VTAPAALRRPSPTLVELRGPSRTRTHRSRVVIGSHPTRTTFDVLRALDRRATPQPKPWMALLGLSLSFRANHREPMPSRWSPSWSDGTTSPGLLAPYDTVPGRWIRCSTADPSAAAAPRPGFGYPPRGCYLRPSRRLRVGASMGFALQGFPFVAIGAPLGVLALLPLPAACEASRGTPFHHAAGFKALFLRRIRAVTGITSDFGRRYLLGVLLSRACSHPTWRSLWVAAPPLSPSGGLTSKVRLGLRVSKYAWVGRSVSGPPALLSFSTFRRSRRSVHRSLGRAHCFASRAAPPG
jgi:hypothetical protein